MLTDNDFMVYIAGTGLLFLTACAAATLVCVILHNFTKDDDDA